MKRSELNELDQSPSTINFISGRIPYKKVSYRKKTIPMSLYRSRTFNFKERVEKRNNLNNNSE